MILILLLSSFANTQNLYESEIAQWRRNYETNLTADNGWLTLAGLFWLKEGVNTIGAGGDFDIQLTDNFARVKFGEIVFQQGKAVLRVEKGVNALIDGKEFSETTLVSDEKGQPSVIETGTQTFYLIKRENKYGIRLRDTKSKTLTEFKGLHWFPVEESYKVIAEFEPFAEPKQISVPNIMGGSFKLKSEGLLKFRIKGKKYSLQPVEENGRFFIIFRDTTSKTETYKLGRFLYADKSHDNKIVLDFNKAENPPCAYTPFATCPIPPAQNRLTAEIKAGEKRYDH